MRLVQMKNGEVEMISDERDIYNILDDKFGYEFTNVAKYFCKGGDICRELERKLDIAEKEYDCLCLENENFLSILHEIESETKYLLSYVNYTKRLNRKELEQALLKIIETSVDY